MLNCKHNTGCHPSAKLDSRLHCLSRLHDGGQVNQLISQNSCCQNNDLNCTSILLISILLIHSWEQNKNEIIMKVRWLLFSPSARLPTCSKRNHTKTGGDAKEGWNIVTVKMPGTIGPLHFLHFFIHFVHCPLFSTFNDSTHCHPFSSIVIHFHPISSTVIPCHPISSNVIQLDFRDMWT